MSTSPASASFLPLSPKNHHHYHAQSNASHHSTSPPPDVPTHHTEAGFLSNLTPHFPTHFPHPNPLQTAHHEYQASHQAKQAKKEAFQTRTESPIDEHGFAVPSTSTGATIAAKEAWGSSHGPSSGSAAREVLTGQEKAVQSS